ncbi:universal stress protein [Rhodoblastus acidophilus]|uniref:Universal stress protein n=1 Tax=Rhodoblastus acidophilus TaxID=1074 RepID=A0A6N8DL42_RHOAC|nr:universal stress protein [Rhodoblastus acidophilus]MCW2273022.1 nucleotide-binding universal stress UspA family protein [Rhodoblastus acidophilus]MTV29923.1 universal stress protein [Rhodoblastus acidophilus]
MALRSILIHLTASPRCEARLKLTVELARRTGARLTGLFSQIAEPHRVGVAAEWPPKAYREAAEIARATFARATEGVDAHYQDLNRGAEEDLTPQFVDYSRHFDLVVLGQRMPDNSLIPPDLLEQIIVQSGRPVLIVPYAGGFDSVGARAVFAWSDSRCCARAFADAIPMVVEKTESLIVSLSKAGDEQAMAYRRQSLALAAAHLDAHGLQAKTEQIVLGEIGLMDALLNRAADHGADLLVMGAFGGFRYPLFARGSGSRYLLKHMTLPVLFSH